MTMFQSGPYSEPSDAGLIFPLERLVGLLRAEAEQHQAANADARRRKALLTCAADALEGACRRAEYWKAEHLAGNAEISRLLERLDERGQLNGKPTLADQG